MCSSSTGALEGHSTHFHVGRSDLHLPLDPPAEGLQMAHSFEHIPVLRDEVVSLFASVPPGVVVDATVGGGGHAAALLEAYPALRVVGLDRDPAALEAARERLSPFGDRVTLMPPRSPRWSRFSPVPGSGPLRACSSTWASAPRSSTGPSGGSRSARTARSTCGWTRPPARPPPTWSTPFRWRPWRRCSGRTERDGCPGGSPGPSCGPGH